MIARIWQGATSLNYMPRWLYLIVLAGFGPLLLANLIVGNSNGAVAAGIGGGLLGAAVALRPGSPPPLDDPPPGPRPPTALR